MSLRQSASWQILATLFLTAHDGAFLFCEQSCAYIHTTKRIS